MKSKKVRKPYLKPEPILTEKNDDRDETMRALDDIAFLEPGKNVQIAAKKISQKYKKIREANAKKRFKLLGELEVGHTIETEYGDKVEVTVPPPKKVKYQVKKQPKK